MCPVLSGSEYMLTDRGVKFNSKQFTWLDKELGYFKVYTSPHTPSGNLVIEHKYPFLKASLWKLICNHNTDWDELIHVTTMAYNVFPYSSVGDAPFYLMFECNTFIPMLLKLLLPKLRYRVMIDKTNQLDERNINDDNK